jgi:hypothetical protein
LVENLVLSSIEHNLISLTCLIKKGPGKRILLFQVEFGND